MDPQNDLEQEAMELGIDPFSEAMLQIITAVNQGLELNGKMSDGEYQILLKVKIFLLELDPGLGVGDE